MACALGEWPVGLAHCVAVSILAVAGGSVGIPPETLVHAVQCAAAEQGGMHSQRVRRWAADAVVSALALLCTLVSALWCGWMVAESLRMPRPDLPPGATPPTVPHFIPLRPSPPLDVAAGLHEFGEFTAEDVGTIDSGLNSMVGSDYFLSAD